MSDDDALSAVSGGRYRLVPTQDGRFVLHADGSGSLRVSAAVNAWIALRSAAALAWIEAERARWEDFFRRCDEVAARLAEGRRHGADAVMHQARLGASGT